MNAFSHNLGEVSYPRMERQDLTQGQLGSFKFTPTDEIRSIYQQNTSPLFQQQLADSLSTHDRLRAATTALPPNVTPHVHTSPPLLSSRFSPTTINDPAFFEKYVKGDLADARLRLGPAAFRAAIDSASMSPKKGSQYTAAPERAMTGREFLQPNIPSLVPRHLRDSSDINSSFSSLPASASETRREEISLIRALASEQESHELTKTALRLEKAARAQSECESQRLSDLNKSLRGTVNLLKSIISHNEKKKQQQQNVEVGGPSDSVSDAEVARLHGDGTASQRLSGQHDKTGPEANQHNFDQFQNLNLLLTDRRSIVNTASLKQNSQLIDLYGLTQPPPPFTPSEYRTSSQINTKASKMALSRDESIELKVGNAQQPDVPDKVFVERQEAKKPIEGRDEDDSADVAIAGMGPSTDINFDSLSLNESKDPSGPSSELVEEDASIKMAMPNTPNIKWQITAASPVFNNDYQKYHHLGPAKQFHSAFYDHPVRYMPNKAEKNLYRTVMIDHIPLGTSYQDILTDIRGGALESIQLIKPIGKATGFMTARVVFNYELDAQTLYQHGQNPGMFLNGERLRVWQVLQPTYPKNVQLEKDVFEQEFTRTLIIADAPETVLAKLPLKLATQIRQGFVIDIGKAPDGATLVEFTSVTESAKALRLFVQDRDFAGAAFDFEEDSCARPY